MHHLPVSLQELLAGLGKRSNNREAVAEVVRELCAWKPMKISDLASLLGRSDKYLLREFVSPMREQGVLQYSISDRPNHPEQGYLVADLKSEITT